MQQKVFFFTKGEPARFQSSDLAERSFCGTCGCQLTFQAVGDPGGVPTVTWITLGSLDQLGDIVLTHHIFTDDQPSWLHLQDELPRWPSQLPWLRTQDELARPTVPEDDWHDDQATPLHNGDSFEGGCLCGDVRYAAIAGEAPTTCNPGQGSFPGCDRTRIPKATIRFETLPLPLTHGPQEIPWPTTPAMTNTTTPS